MKDPDPIKKERRAVEVWFRRRTEPTSADAALEKIRELENRIQALELAWEDTYLKLRRITGRLVKSAALDAEETPAVVGRRVSRASLLVKKGDNHAG